MEEAPDKKKPVKKKPKVKALPPEPMPATHAQAHPLLLDHLRKEHLALSSPRVELRSSTEMIIR